MIYKSNQKWWGHDVFTGAKTTQERINSQSAMLQVFTYSTPCTLAVSLSKCGVERCW